MNENRHKNSVAVMTLEIVQQVLSHPDKLTDVVNLLLHTIRELSGAKTVIMTRYMKDRERGSDHQLLGVVPLRREELARGETVSRLFDLLHDLPHSTLWLSEKEKGELATLLPSLGFPLSLALPLDVGPQRVGGLLVIGLHDNHHIDSTVEIVETLSGIVALILGNSILIEKQKETITKLRETEKDLKNHEEHLKELVAEKTGKLHETNEELLKEIGERKKKEQELIAMEEKYRDLYENAPDMFFSVDAKTGNIIECNDTLLKTTGFAREEILSFPVHRIFAPESATEVRGKWFPQFLQTGKIDNTELKLRKRDGGEIDVALNVSAVRDGEGHILHSRSVLRNITERKRVEREHKKFEAKVQQAQKLESLGILAGGIAHDFNNILMGILGNAEMAIEDISQLSPGREHLEEILIAAKRASELSRQMLAYSGRGNFFIKTINLNELVREMTHLLEVSISKKAQLHYQLADNLPPIDCDVTQVRQVVMNLITNASEAIPEEGGAITITTGVKECDRSYLDESFLQEELPEGLYIRLVVEDTGGGMDRETRERLFDPFFTTKFTGRGLGLAAVLGIIRGHKGDIRVISELHRGTRFEILFPASSQQESTRQTPSPQEGEPPWKGKGTVLLVDDEEMVRNVGRKMLQRIGYEVLLAKDGEEALQVLESRRDSINGILLDLTMPRMSGEECFQELRRREIKIPVIMTSGYTEQELSQRFKGKEIAAFLEKPFRMTTLKEKAKKIFSSLPH